MFDACCRFQRLICAIPETSSKLSRCCRCRNWLPVVPEAVGALALVHEYLKLTDSLQVSMMKLGEALSPLSWGVAYTRRVSYPWGLRVSVSVGAVGAIVFISSAPSSLMYWLPSASIFIMSQPW